MIPQEKNASVEKGLREGFGVTACDALHPMDAGLGSDLLFRMVVGEESYSLRIMTRIDEINDPRRRFTCMTMAADAGIAPRVWYADMEQGVCITDFVEERPLPADQARLLIPQLLRKLHALPRFPKEFNYVTASKAIERFHGMRRRQRDAVHRVRQRFRRGRLDGLPEAARHRGDRLVANVDA